MKNYEFYCVNYEVVRIEMSGELKIYFRFNNYNRLIKVFFVVYVDFELIFISILDFIMVVVEGERRSFINKY